MNWHLLKKSSRPLVSMSMCRSNSNYVKVTDSVAFRRITMCNDKQRNALGIDMIRSLQAAVDTTDMHQCRVLILSSNQAKIFSAGHNLKELTTEKGAELHQAVFEEFTNLCLNLKRLPIPVIAEVKGLAAAGGLQLALSCDLIIAANRASFSTPGVKFGVFCTTPGVALSRNVSQKIAAKMLFTGEAIGAKEALQQGLISEMVDLDSEGREGALEERVNQVCEMIAANSSGVISLGKKAFYEQVNEASVESAYEIGCRTMVENLKFEDTQSGLAAFAAKKKPVWSHSTKKITF